MSTYRRYFNSNQLVFITIVTYNRNPILIKHIELIREAFRNIKYDFKIIAACIMEDHIHLLIQTKNSKEIPMIVSFFKQHVSRNINTVKQTDIQKKRNEKGIWQRRYYDHIIRDEDDYNKHLDYIHYNPMKHYNIYPKNWQYSSFSKFVKLGLYEENWCNFEDKNKINNLDLE